MTKILVISNLYPSKQDPVYGTFVQNFIDSIADSGEFDQIDKVVIKGRTSSKIKKILKYVAFYSGILFKTLFFHYEMVYVHIITHAALPLRFVSLFKKLPLVFNIHGEDLLTQTQLSAYFLEKAKPLLYQAKLIVVPSHFFARKAMQLIPKLDKNKIFVSPSGGVNESFFRKPKSEEHTSSFTIGYVSRVDRGKGWNVFIDAIQEITRKGLIPGLKAEIIGNGGEVKQMEEKIKNEGNIEYVGPVAYKQLPEYYSHFDLFVFPTLLEESLGLVGLEAMAAGVPVIGSRIGGLTDYIAHETNGYFFETGHTESLVGSIMRYYQLPKEQKYQMRENAYQTALLYENKTSAEKLIKKLKSIINTSNHEIVWN